jgi:hypothetical protein
MATTPKKPTRVLGGTASTPASPARAKVSGSSMATKPKVKITAPARKATVVSTSSKATEKAKSTSMKKKVM